MLTFALAAVLATAPVTIPRVDQGNLLSWQVPDARTVYLEDRTHRWYRADMAGPCVVPPFNGALGYRLGPNGRIDAGSAIITRGRTCEIRTLTSASGPPAKP